MSLVHEALRKAEREKQLKAGTTPSASPAPRQPASPQPAQVHTPVVHASVASAPVAPARRELASSSQMPEGEQPGETNRFVLPALLGCVAIVAIIAIVFLVSNFSSVLRQTRENVPAAPAAAVAGTVAQPTAPADPPATPSSVAQPTADSATTPNVPSPTALPPVDESKYKITGIMTDSDGRRMAVINGRDAYEGYYVDGATVERIEADRVTLDVKGQRGVLRLH
jgi:hypothetical protein